MIGQPQRSPMLGAAILLNLKAVTACLVLLASGCQPSAGRAENVRPENFASVEFPLALVESPLPESSTVQADGTCTDPEVIARWLTALDAGEKGYRARQSGQAMPKNQVELIVFHGRPGSGAQDRTFGLAGSIAENEGMYGKEIGDLLRRLARGQP